MDHFQYQGTALYAENVAVADIAKNVGTPSYIYSRATLERHFSAYDRPFGSYPHLICYAVKANSNIAILNVLARLGCGFDIVSGGELQRVLKAGGDPARIIFSGVGKTHVEMKQALQNNIHCFNVESLPELERLNEVAGNLNKIAPVSLRINPDVDVSTHPYISTGLHENKFGIPHDSVFAAYQLAAGLSHIDIIGIDCHIGSQLTELSPLMDALDRLLDLVEKLAQQGIEIKHLDLGGGLGVRYDTETPPEPSEYITAILKKITQRKQASTQDLQIILEPGRSIAANAGILLTRVEYLKTNMNKHFAIVDAAMNDLLRPSLYQAWQQIIPVDKAHSDTTSEQEYDIVGPVCETGDFLGKNRKLALKQGDLLAIRTAGAYGFTMSSNYNSRNRAAEILVDDHKSYLIRERESYIQQMNNEHLIPKDD